MHATQPRQTSSAPFRDAGFDGVMMIEEIADARRRTIREQKRVVPQADLEKQLPERTEHRPFSEALVRPGMSLIAEFKRRSPSRGDIAPNADVTTMVTSYERGGAAALSILTEPDYFRGELDHLRAARTASSLPLLCKDFVVDEYQLYEAAAAGADAVLLMVGVLDEEQLVGIYEEARALDLDCLVEIHDEDELEVAVEIADVIGINNRKLRAPFANERVDLEVTRELHRAVPAGKTVVSESGIRNRRDIEELERIGVDAVLVGTQLMTSDDPEATVRELTMDEERTREHYMDRASEG